MDCRQTPISCHLDLRCPGCQDCMKWTSVFINHPGYDAFVEHLNRPWHDVPEEGTQRRTARDETKEPHLDLWIFFYLFFFTFSHFKTFSSFKSKLCSVGNIHTCWKKKKHCESQMSLKSVCCSSFQSFFPGNLDIFYALMQQMRSPRMVRNNCSVRVFLIGQLSMKGSKRYPVFPWVTMAGKTVTSLSQGPFWNFFFCFSTSSEQF